MLKLLPLLFIVSIYSCGGESDGGDSNQSKGPENPIDNTASESEFHAGSSDVVKTFDDYTNMKKKFIPTTSLQFTENSAFGNSYTSKMDEQSSTESSDSDELVDPQEIKADFEKLTTCNGSFNITDEMIQNLKEEIESLVKELKEGKFSEDASDMESPTEDSTETTGELKLVKVETDDAIAYDITIDGEAVDGMSIDGRISGRSNKEEGIFQFYKKINQSFDYNKIFGSLFPSMGEAAEAQEGEGSIDFNFPTGVVTMEIESTVESNTKDKSIVSTQKIKQDTSGTKKAEDSVSMNIELKESVKGGDLPEYSQSVNQSMTDKDGTHTVNYEFKMALDENDKLQVEMKLDGSEDDQDFEFKYELEADSNTCTLAKE